ncbi:LysM peptidoglycan-binding domain-containing protein, partial [Syntrophomonas wolfei]
MLNLLQQHRRYTPLGLILCGLIFLFVMSSLGVQMPAYSVFIDQQEKFQTDDPEAVNLALQRIIAQERKRCQQDIDLVNQVEIEKVFAKRENIIPAEEVEKELRKNLQFESLATSIVVDGKAVASVKNRELAEKILNNLKREYSWLDEGEELLEVTFAEKVELRDTKVPSQEIIEPPQAYQLIKIGTNNPEKYLVKEGDSLWLIARRNDMYVNDIVVANNLNSDKLSLGQELLLVKSKPYITVMTQVKGERVEAIPFQTKVVVDTSAGTSVRVKQEGKNGEKQVVYQATKLNGVLQEKDVK